MIYFDNAATTKISPKAMEAMIEVYNDFWGNPSSTHALGTKAKSLLSTCRNKIASIFDVPADTIYFTSGGTESNNQVIKSARMLGSKVAVSAIEHSSIMKPLKEIRDSSIIPINSEGFVEIEGVLDAINSNANFISVMYANNEIGTIQPIQDIAEICKANDVLFHTDAVQAIGHIPVDFSGVDFLSLSAHKFNGPKGIGLLYARKQTKLSSLVSGGGQEFAKRSGTENLPAIVGMTIALEEAYNNMQANMLKTSRLRDNLLAGIEKVADVRVNGSMSNRLPGNLNVEFMGINGHGLLTLLNEKGLCASANSACSAVRKLKSHVLLALDEDHDRAVSSIRFSLSQDNEDFEVERAINIIKGCLLK